MVQDLAALLLIQFPASTSEKAARDGLRTGSLPQSGKPDGVPGSWLWNGLALGVEDI